MFLAEKLAHIKKQRHLTNEEIATQSGVPLGTVNKICAGQTQNPSPHALLQISQVLHTPVCYLLDDSVPLEYSRTFWAEQCGLLFLSPEEVHLIDRYRALNPDAQRAFSAVADDIGALPQPSPRNLPSRQLICYIPMESNQRTFYSDNFLRKFILVAEDALSRQADFALQLVNRSMEPVYPSGTVLLCRKGPVSHNQFGFFQLNRETYVRKLYTSGGKTKLVPVNVDLRTIIIHPGDDYKCLGTILGPARCYNWTP